MSETFPLSFLDNESWTFFSPRLIAEYVINMLCSAAELCFRDLHRLGCMIHGGRIQVRQKKGGRIWSQGLNLPPFWTNQPRPITVHKAGMWTLSRRFRWSRDSTHRNPAAGDPVFIYSDDCQLHVKIIKSLQRILALPTLSSRILSQAFEQCWKFMCYFHSLLSVSQKKS